MEDSKNNPSQGMTPKESLAIWGFLVLGFIFIFGMINFSLVVKWIVMSEPVDATLEVSRVEFYDPRSGTDKFRIFGQFQRSDGQAIEQDFSISEEKYKASVRGIEALGTVRQIGRWTVTSVPFVSVEPILYWQKWPSLAILKDDGGYIEDKVTDAMIIYSLAFICSVIFYVKRKAKA